jgi:hypothetical protein
MGVMEAVVLVLQDTNVIMELVIVFLNVKENSAVLMGVMEVVVHAHPARSVKTISVYANRSVLVRTVVLMGVMEAVVLVLQDTNVMLVAYVNVYLTARVTADQTDVVGAAVLVNHPKYARMETVFVYLTVQVSNVEQMMGVEIHVNAQPENNVEQMVVVVLPDRAIQVPVVTVPRVRSVLQEHVVIQTILHVKINTSIPKVII